MAGVFCRFGDMDSDATVPIKKRRIYLEAIGSPPPPPSPSSLPFPDPVLVDGAPPDESLRKTECFSLPTDELDGNRASFELPDPAENCARIGRNETRGRIEIYVDGDPLDDKTWFETEHFSPSMDELDGNRASFEPLVETAARMALYEMRDRTELPPDDNTLRKTEHFSLLMDGLDGNRASIELPESENTRIALNKMRDQTEIYVDRDHPPDNKTLRKTECFSSLMDKLDGNRASFELLEPPGNNFRIAQNGTRDRKGIYVDQEPLNDKTLLKTDPPQCCSSPEDKLDGNRDSFEPSALENNRVTEKDKRDGMAIYANREHPCKSPLRTEPPLERVVEREECCSSSKDESEEIRASFEPPESENTRIARNEKRGRADIYVDGEPPDETLLKTDPPLPPKRVVGREQCCSSPKDELEEDTASIEPPSLEYASMEVTQIAENGKQEQMESYIFGFGYGYGYDQIEAACESTVCNEKTSESYEVDCDEPSSQVDLVDFFASERRKEVCVGWIEDDDDDDDINELEEVEEYADYSEEEEEEVDGGLAFDERRMIMPLLHRVEGDNNNNKRGLATCPIREFGNLDSYGIREGSENGIKEREADAIPEAKSFDVDIKDGHGENGSLGRYLPRGNFSGRGSSVGRRISSPSECASDLSLLSSRNGSRTQRAEEDGHARFASSRDFGCAKSFGRGVGLAGVVRFDHWIEGSGRANQWSSNHNQSGGFTLGGSRNTTMANDRSVRKAGMSRLDVRSSVMTGSRHGGRRMAQGGARRDSSPPSSSMDTGFPGRMGMAPRRGTERNLDRSGYLGCSFRMDSDIYQTYPPATQRLSSSSSSRQDYNFSLPKRSWDSSNSPQRHSGSYTRSLRWTHPRSNNGGAGGGGLASALPQKKGRYHRIVPKDKAERERILPHARCDAANSSKLNSMLLGSPSKWFNHPHRHQEAEKSQEQQDFKRNGRRLSPHVVHGSALTDERDLQLLAAARHSSPPPPPPLSSRHKQIDQFKSEKSELVGKPFNRSLGSRQQAKQGDRDWS